MIRLIAPITLVVILGSVIAATWMTLHTLGEPLPVTSRKLSDAKRILHYKITHEQGPLILLSGTETTLRIISHVVLPPGLSYNPKRRIRYGLRLRILPPGKDGSEALTAASATALWEQDIHTQARQSKDVFMDGVWAYENSFTRDPDVQLSDDRMFIVHMPPDIPRNALLQVTLLGDQVTEGLIRIYNQLGRAERTRKLILQSMELDDELRFTQASTYDPWVMVPEEERMSLVRYRTERLSAVGERGIDYQADPLYYTGFRLPLDVLEDGEPIRIHRYRFGVINVVGPTTLSVSVPGPVLPSGDVDPAVEIYSVSDGISAPMPHALVPVGTEDAVVTVPPGLHSVRFATSSPHQIELRVSGPKNAAFGAPADVGEEIGSLRPDEMRIPVFLTGPDLPQPVIVAGLVGGDELSRVFKIRAHFVETSAASLGEAGALSYDEANHFAGTLTVTYFDQNGAVLDEDSHPLAAERTFYEWLDRTGQPLAGLSEWQDIRILMPPGTYRAEIRTSALAAVRLYRYLEGEQTYELPYRDARLGEDIIWRYVRVEERVWWPMRPLNQEQLASGNADAAPGAAPGAPAPRTSQIATLVAQARLEPRGRGDEAGDDGGKENPSSPCKRVASTVIRPLDNPERHSIIEPIPPEKKPCARTDWGSGMVAAVPKNGSERYIWGKSQVSQATLHYWLDPQDLGNSVTVTIDGKHQETYSPATTHGFWSLPSLPPGPHVLEVRSDAASLTLYVDRLPASRRVALFRMREVFLMRRAPIRVAVRKPEGDALTLSMIVYAPGTGERKDLAVRSVIGGGQPKRVFGVVPYLTKADREHALPASESAKPALFADRQTGAAGYPRRLDVHLGPDLTAGTHQVEAYSVTDAPLWVRFYVLDEQTSRAPALQWKLSNDP